MCIRDSCKAAYQAKFAVPCFMCGAPVVDERCQLDPPEVPDLGDDPDAPTLSLVPRDSPAVFHPECLRCVDCHDALDDGHCFLGPDDGLPYCDACHARKHGKCFETGVPFAPGPHKGASTFSPLESFGPQINTSVSRETRIHSLRERPP